MLTAAAELRRWARGSLPLGAATELLLRAHAGRFAEPGWPWTKPVDGGVGVNFAEITSDHVSSLSEGERRVLLIAASLGAGHPVDLSDVASGLDRTHPTLVLAAVSHAGTAHQDTELSGWQDGDPVKLVPLRALVSWPGLGS